LKTRTAEAPAAAGVADFDEKETATPANEGDSPRLEPVEVGLFAATRLRVRVDRLDCCFEIAAARIAKGNEILVLDVSNRLRGDLSDLGGSDLTRVGVADLLEPWLVAGVAELLDHVLDGRVVTGRAGRTGAVVLVRDPLEGLEVRP
jgi:hypothetical protein